MADEDLKRYREMRDFALTPEPAGKGDVGGGEPTFVIQKHAATRLHYDLRFEVDGVMPSWAVPKGPSYDPKVKRLAMHVEDHPLDYQTFEGTIPKGQYGGGTVIVWDRGTYRNITEHAGQPVAFRDAVKKGHVSVWIEGEKLKGGWSLTRTSGSGEPGSSGEPGKESWILVKRNDEHANPDLDVTEIQPNSVATGRTMEEVAGAVNGPSWTRAVATWQLPMLAELAKAPLLDDGWLIERKLDGLRCVAVRNGDEVQLWSRNHLSFNARFPSIVSALGALPVDNFVLDGEIVAYHGDRTSFGHLQRSDGGNPPVFAVFDLLHLLGRSTTELPLTERKALLEKLLAPGEILHLVQPLSGSLEDLLDEACRSGWEGLIAKRPDGVYVSGRSSGWRKLKCSASQEMVIAGWTEPKGARFGFGALLLGYYENGDLRFAGKVGTGFDDALLRDLSVRLQALEQSSSPFVDPVKEKSVHWARPELVAAIEFSEWTRDGKLRHPRFSGIRPDKVASEVVRESGSEE